MGPRARGIRLAPTVGTLVALLGARLASGEVSVTASVDAREIGVEDTVEYSVVISGEEAGGSRLTKAPEISGISDIQGPQQSSATSMSIVGNRVTSSQKITYTWTLTPKGTGSIEIGAAEVTAAGKKRLTEKLSVKVVPGSVRPRSRSGARGLPADPFFGGDPFEQLFGRRAQAPAEKLTVTAEVDKHQVFVGEAVRLTYRIMGNVQVVGLRLDSGPTTEGFRVEEIDLPDKPVQTTTKEGLESAIVKELVLYPLSEGKLQISGSAWTAQYMSSRDIFPRDIARQTPAIPIQVLPVPREGAPPDWSGAVGTFAIDASIDRQSAAIGEPVTVTYILSGFGDLRGVTRLPLATLPDFRVYDPEAKESVAMKKGKLVSEKSFRYVMIPKAPGTQVIPPVKLSFFDPATRTFGSTEARGFEVAIEKGAESAAEPGGSVPAVVAPVKTTELSRDVRYLKGFPGPEALRASGQIWEGPAFHAAWIAPLLLNFLLLGRRWRSAHVSRHGSVFRSRGALGRASAGVKRATRLLGQGDAKEFHEQLAAALTGYVADRFDLPKAGLTGARIEELLEGARCDEALRRQMRDLLHECDYARFTPAAEQTEDMSGRAQRSGELLRELDRSLGRARIPAVATAAALLFLAASLPVAAAPGEAETSKRWQEATQLYQEGKFDESAAVWRRLVEDGVDAHATWYNLGNAELKGGHVGKAIAAYRHALERRPGDPDALANVAFATERAVDEVARVAPQRDAASFLLEMASPDQAATAALALFVASQLSLAVLLAGQRGPRGLLVSLCAMTLAGALVAGGYAYASERHAVAREQGVVLEAKVDVKAGPGAENATLFVIHEGLTVRVRERQSGWALVVLPNELAGWVPVAALELI